MTSGGGKNWRGGRAPRNSSQQDEAVPSWKQSRHKAAAKSRPKGMRSKLLIALTCVVLIALVAIVIAFWDPQKVYRTHFVVLNLLEQSQDFDAGSSMSLPEGIESKTTERVVTSCHPETMSLQTSDSRDMKNLDEGQTVVIWLQSTFIPEPNGDFHCLIRNSTPNLNDASQFVSLQTLKSELDKFVKKHSSARLLLLVDSAPVNSVWRTGCLHSNLVEVFEQWTSEIKSLVVILSSPANGLSEPGQTGSDGKSIFGHFASVGLSTLADSNSDNKLTAAEYCTYISERTNAWVRDHRDTSGQAVTVLPALEQLSKSSRDFTVVADLISMKSNDEMPAQKANANVSQIEKMWLQRETLMARGGPRWDPLLWNSLTGQLTRAEHGYLSGNTKSVERILPEAERTLREIETLTNEICPKVDSFLADRGRALSEFNDLPSLVRIQQWFKTESIKPDSTELPVSPENVVVSVIGRFPFSSVSLNAPADIGAIRARRAAAEAAVAQLIACPDQLTQTVKRMESSLLLSEDRLFTHHSGPGSASADEPDALPLILALEDFAVARDSAETTLFGIFDIAPTLTRWAAETCFRLPDSDRKIWHSVLLQNTLEADVNGASQNTMSDPLKGIAAENHFSLPDYERDAANLRAETFRLLVRARVLKQSLAFHEPDNGFSAEELKATIAKLNLAQMDAASSQRQVFELIESICTSAIGDSSAKRVGKIRARHFLRSALILTAIKADTRSKVLRTLQKWDDDLASPADGSETDDQVVSSKLPIVADEALWMLQILHLLPINSEQSEKMLSTAWDKAEKLEIGEANQEHSTVADFGAAIRELWRQNKENVIAALQDTTANSHSILRIADQQARLFSGFDTHGPTLQSPTARLHQLNRIQYCLMHADRILSGLWIEPDDAAPLLQNGWYARTSRLWLNAATRSVQALANEALEAPVSLSESLRQLETRLTDSGEFHLTFQPEPGSIDLGEQAKDTGNINGSVTMNGCEGIIGETAVLVPVAVNSSVKVDHNAAGLRIGTNPVKLQLTFHRQGNPGTGECESLLFRPETFFRGRFVRSADEISVNPCAPEEFTIQRSARPPKASLTVSGNDPRPVVLILDYSLSMTEPLTNEPGTARFEEALATLVDLVEGGNLNGSRVMLNVYGHRVKYTAATDQMIENPLYANCFRKPIPPGLGALEDIAEEFDGTIGSRAVQDSFNRTISNLRCSKPFGITPLIKAITDALDGSLKDTEGIVIVVTDGEASDLNEKKRNLLAAALRKKAATSVNIVAFDVAAQAAVRKKLQDTFDPFNIRVSDAVERHQLFDQIVELLGPRSYTVKGNNGLEFRPAALGMEVSELTPANDFRVSFSGVTTRTPIALQPGDVLKLNFDHTAKRFIYLRDKRSVSVSEAAVGGNLTNDSPDRLKSIKPPHVSDLSDPNKQGLGMAELFLMLDHKDNELPVRQPAEIQFCVRPASSASTYRPHAVHETYNSGTGAPGWDLKIEEWPKDQLFLVDAIWKMEHTTPEYVLRWNELKPFDAIDNALLIKQNGLPDCHAWITLRDDALQIRLDPVDTAPIPPQPVPLGDDLARNRVDNIRIEIGKKDTSDQNKTFRPWEIDTKVVRLESGSVRYEFVGEQITPENLADAQIAFTSSAARKAGATGVESFRLE